MIVCSVAATLDATKEEHWFEAVRELISHLQERRVWMSETRPTDLMDDDFLFPMGSSRYSTYVADSDVESLKGVSQLSFLSTCLITIKSNFYVVINFV